MHFQNIQGVLGLVSVNLSVWCGLGLG